MVGLVDTLVGVVEEEAVADVALEALRKASLCWTSSLNMCDLSW